jgi:hypothetical protein
VEAGEVAEGGAVDILDVDEDPGAAPLVEAVRALEEAARVEAESAPFSGPPAVDVAGLSEALAGLQSEVAALRMLVESLATDLRERLEAVHEEVLVLTGQLEPVGGRAPSAPAPVVDETAILPPVEAVPVDEDDGDGDGDGEGRRAGRRILLVVLLLLVALLVAGLIVVTVVYGWDAVRDQMSEMVPAVRAFQGVVP